MCLEHAWTNAPRASIASKKGKKENAKRQSISSVHVRRTTFAEQRGVRRKNEIQRLFARGKERREARAHPHVDQCAHPSVDSSVDRALVGLRAGAESACDNGGDKQNEKRQRSTRDSTPPNTRTPRQPSPSRAQQVEIESHEPIANERSERRNILFR